MSQRGRPRNTQPSIRVAIAGRLHPEYDADILAWLDAIPKGQRMNALKIALRSGGMTLDQSYQSDKSDEDHAKHAADDILSHWEF